MINNFIVFQAFAKDMPKFDESIMKVDVESFGFFRTLNSWEVLLK